jgi:hypothetical protein
VSKPVAQSSTSMGRSRPSALTMTCGVMWVTASVTSSVLGPENVGNNSFE